MGNFGFTMILMMLLILLVFAGIAAYYFTFLRRLAGLLHIPRKKRWQRILLIIIPLMLAVGMALMSVNLFSKTALVLLHFAAFSAVIDLIVWIVKRIRKGNLNKNAGWYKLLRCGAVPLTLSVAVFVYGWFNIRNVVETTYTVTTEKTLHQDEHRILMLADIHYGTTADAELISELVEEVSRQEPDLVLLGGDMVDENTSREQLHEIFALLGEIPSKYGTYYVSGNHDKSPYSRTPNYTTEELYNCIAENGIVFLEDEAVLINDDISLVGRVDFSEWRMAVSDVMQAADTEKFTLVLDHQPQEYEAYAASGADLMLSGHTHYGQIFPAGFFLEPMGFADNAYGRKTIGDMEGIVTSGVTGWGYPIRTMGHSEYLIVTVKGN